MTRLDPRLLLQGYATGIFPMADSRDAHDLFWVEPRNRAILPLDGFHLSRSLRRDDPRGPLRGHSRPRLRRRDRRLCRSFGNLDQCRDRAGDADSPLPRPRPFDRSLERRPARRRPLRRQPRPRLLRRKHVQPADRCVQGRAGLARRAAQGRQFHASRLPVHDRHLASLGAVDDRRARPMSRCCTAALGGGEARRCRAGGCRRSACRLRSARRGCSMPQAPAAPARSRTGWSSRSSWARRRRPGARRR